MYNIAKIAIWSIIECGTGIIAGSVATFRPLLRLVPFLSQSSSAGKSGVVGNSHLHSQPLNDLRSTKNPKIGLKTGTQSEGDYLELSDAESQKHILKKTTIEFS